MTFFFQRGQSVTGSYQLDQAIPRLKEGKTDKGKELGGVVTRG
jgi:hypothetical protein